MLIDAREKERQRPVDGRFRRLRRRRSRRPWPSRGTARAWREPRQGIRISLLIHRRVDRNPCGRRDQTHIVKANIVACGYRQQPRNGKHNVNVSREKGKKESLGRAPSACEAYPHWGDKHSCLSASSCDCPEPFATKSAAWLMRLIKSSCFSSSGNFDETRPSTAVLCFGK